MLQEVKQYDNGNNVMRTTRWPLTKDGGTEDNDRAINRDCELMQRV